MIRPTVPADTPTLVLLAEQTGVFKPVEIQALREVLDDYHAHYHVHHRCVTLEDQGRVLGVAYYAPEAMTDRAWSLWWIAVQPGQQGRGLGRELLRYVEEDTRAAGARLLFIDTSSLPHYEPTRRFYLKHGYAVTGVLSDFYADGDDKVVFRKRLAVASEDGTP
jgi:ribosomal protein S18 acetylase RimI-like enzyme